MVVVEILVLSEVFLKAFEVKLVNQDSEFGGEVEEVIELGVLISSFESLDQSWFVGFLEGFGQATLNAERPE
jgi:hypothetical protein